jgi:hypothetical protein
MERECVMIVLLSVVGGPDAGREGLGWMVICTSEPLELCSSSVFGSKRFKALTRSRDVRGENRYGGWRRSFRHTGEFGCGRLWISVVVFLWVFGRSTANVYSQAYIQYVELISNLATVDNINHPPVWSSRRFRSIRRVP